MTNEASVSKNWQELIHYVANYTNGPVLNLIFTDKIIFIGKIDVGRNALLCTNID